MSKQFKLVYENAGELKGSYTGIPANDDVDVIKRTVLEGKEDPTPVGPTIDTEYITELDSLNPMTLKQLFTASGQVGDPDLAAAVQDLFSQSKWHCPLPIENDSEEYFDSVIFLMEVTSPNSADLFYFPVTDPSTKYTCQCEVQIDAETGDGRIIFWDVNPEEAGE